MRLARRVARLEDPLAGGRLPCWAEAIVGEVATEWGLDPAAVLRETMAILAVGPDAWDLWPVGEGHITGMWPTGGEASAYPIGPEGERP